MPRRHDVRPNPALDECASVGRRFVEERLPRCRLAGHHDGEHIETRVFATDALEQRTDLVFDAVIHAHGDSGAAGSRHHLGGLFDRLGTPGIHMVRRVWLRATAAPRCNRRSRRLLRAFAQCRGLHRAWHLPQPQCVP